MRKSFSYMSLYMFLLLPGYLTAQVKIGGDPAVVNANSLLELESTSRGLLMPRLTTAQINAMVAPPDGLVVYNTTIPAYQVRSGGVWRSLITSVTNDWSISGNNNINSSRFIGSINNASFRVRTNNLQRLMVDSLGQVIIGKKDFSGVAMLNVYNEDNINSLYVTNSSTNVTQFGVRSFVNGVAAGSSRTAGEFIATGAGNNNTGIASTASGATDNFAGTFTASGNAGGRNIGVWGFASSPGGGTSYAVYGSIGGTSIGNDWAGYFKGRTYSSNRMVLGLDDRNENAQLTVRTPDTSYNAIFSSSANPGGNGILSTYAGAPSIFYAYWGIAPSTGNNYAGYFSGNAHITGTLTNPSDERLKENIKPIEGALDKVLKLGVHTYNFKPEYNFLNLAPGKQFGYLAQNLQEVFPELVHNTVDKSKGPKDLLNYKAVNYIGMIPILTKALQEEHQQHLQTQQQLDKLTADNEALKQRLTAIETQLSKLTATTAGK